MNFLEEGVHKGLFVFDDDSHPQYITYTHGKEKYRFTEPKEKVRAETYCDLVLNYGYEPQYISLDESVYMGPGVFEYADIVVWMPDGTHDRALLVIVCKEAACTDEPNDIRYRVRLYAGYEGICGKHCGYVIGNEPIKIWRILHWTYFKPIDKPPTAYAPDVVYAYIDRSKKIPPSQRHFAPLKSITSHELKSIFLECRDILCTRGQRSKKEALDEFNKLLFLKIYDELQQEEHHLQPYIFQRLETEMTEDMWQDEEEKYLHDIITKAFAQAHTNRNVEAPFETLDLSPPEIVEIILLLERVSLIHTDNDPTGLAFETFSEASMSGEYR